MDFKTDGNLLEDLQRSPRFLLDSVSIELHAAWQTCFSKTLRSDGKGTSFLGAFIDR
jgi:hypothetical protein